MAFVSNMNNEDEKNPAQGAVPPTGGAGVQLAPSSGVGSAGSPATPAQPGQPGAGGGFATLDKYLTANQGQAQPLASKVTAGIGQQYNALQGANASTLGDIGNQVASGAPQTANENDIIAKEAANPVSFANDQGNVKQFQGLLNASYAGPASAEGTTGFTNQQNAINQAIATGKNQTTTEAGREQLLSQNEAAPSTSVTGLNSAILSSSPEALGQVENAYKPFSGLLTDLSAGAQDVDQNISKAQSDAAQANTAANKAIADQTAALNAGVQGALTTANAGNANLTKTYNSLVDTLSHGATALSPDQAAALGLTPEQATALQRQGELANTTQYMTGRNFGAPSATTDVNNTAYLQQLAAPVAPTANQVATPQQFQTLMALLSLNNGQVPTGAIIDPAQAAQAGTYVAPTLKGTFDYDKALANATTVEQQERADAQAQANALTAAADAAHNASKSHTFGGNLMKYITPGAQYLANPLATVPKQIGAAKSLASKI